MKRLLFVSLSFCCGAGAALAQHGFGTGRLHDEAGDRVLSDDRGIYIHGQDCVSVAVATSDGFYQLRTVSNTATCNGQTWGVRRTLTLAFDTDGPMPPDLDLAPSDSDSSTESVPARFIVWKLFHKKATTTAVSILILTVDLASGGTTQDAAWEFVYQTQAVIVRNPDGSRSVSLTGDDAVVELLQYVPQAGRKVKPVSYGFFNLPFHLTAAPLP
ncbi:MAG TPA: hypothetical protein VEK15_06915 [Vicinamibacteria bacterium]|nr:hypothetical protein [Vicinamibacteria bacterium]